MLSKLEVVFIRLDIAGGIDLEAHLAEDGENPPQVLGGGVQPPAPERTPGQGDIQPLGSQRARQRGLPQGFALFCKGGFERGFHLVGALTHRRAFLFGQAAQPS